MNPGPAPYPKKLGWWSEARFGLFIHWGPVSQTGKEISWSRDPNPGGPNPGGIPAATYDALYQTFNPVKFNPKQIAQLAKSAGMGYLVFTTKHHDGFCEWDSAYTDYKITNPLSPYRKDIVGPLSVATQQAGLRWGVYYSQPDLHNPDYKVNQSAYDQYFHNQVLELVRKYPKVDLVWFDGLGGSASFWDAQTLFDKLAMVAPNIILNNRCGLPGDYRTPEQTIGGYDDQHPWETCMTIGDQWAYKPNDRYKSGAECIETLARCAGGDGNLLLNIGLRPDGSVDPTQAERLREIGRWMAVNHASIRGTRGGPFRPAPAYASTRTSRAIFIHVFKWTDGSVHLPPLPISVIGATELGGKSVPFSQTADGLRLLLPRDRQPVLDTVIQLRVKGNPLELAPIAP